MSYLIINDKRFNIKYHDTKETLIASFMYPVTHPINTFNAVLDGGLVQKIKVMELASEDEEGNVFSIVGHIIEDINGSGHRTAKYIKIRGCLVFKT